MKFSEILGIVGAASANNNGSMIPHPRKVTTSGSVSVSGASSSRIGHNFGRSGNGRNRKHSGGGAMSDMELVRLGMGYMSDSNVINNPVVNFRKVRKRCQSHIEDVDDYSNSNSNLTLEENLYYQADSEVGSGPSSSGAMSRSSNSNLQSNSGAPTTLTTGRRQMFMNQFMDIVRQSNVACQNGDFSAAVALYSEALKIDPTNHILYSNRSAAFIKLGQFARALQDAMKAKEINPKWSKAYYRQGVALQCLGKHSDALAAFSAGLAEDPKSSQLLSGLIEAATKSPLKAKLEPTFAQLASMKLTKSPFVVISVIGQELLASSQYIAAVVVLESALRIGSANSKLKGSVYSALSSAFWALNSLDKAIGYMQQDLAVAKSLEDVPGECRAHGNLGSAFFSQSNFKDALTSHRYQLVLAMKCKDTQAAASALTSLGHVYTAIGDYSNALASHKQCVQLVKQMGDPLQEAREIGNVGAVYLVMGDFDNAIDCHTEHLRIAKQSLGNKVEEARAYSNLGSSYHYRRNFEQAITFHNHVLKISQDLGDKNIEARAYAGLGHAARCMGDYPMAKMWHAKQLDMALATKDKVNEGRACSNLGIVFQLLGDHDAALKLHQSHLNIASTFHDRAGMGRAYGNIGNAYNAMGYYDQAIKYHKQELAISKEVNDRSSEASTHGNLAVGYQALGMCDKALVHYHSHLNISRELKDTSGEACALLNLGNCHSSLGDFGQAIPFYETYLMLSQELNDIEGEAKACHFLGFAHYSLGHFKEAVRYYNQDLCLAKELQNTANIARAYCNLGLTHLCVGNLEEALECQKYFLAVTHTTKDANGKYRALGNIGNIMLKMRKPDEAVKVFQKQVLLAKESGDKNLEAAAYGALGSAHRILKRFDLALGFHTQELTILQELNDSSGECRSHGNLGAVHMSLGNYTSAIKCYEEMLERAKELKDSMTEAQAYGNLGISRINMGNYEEAANLFELQLSVLDSPSLAKCHLPQIHLEKGRACGNLGECLQRLGDHEEAIRCHEKSLQIFTKSGNLREQEKTYRPLGLACKALGNTQAALSYFEKRLEMIKQLMQHEHEQCSNSDSGQGQVTEELVRLKAAALSDLGQEYLDMRNFEQAVNCFQQQLSIATKNVEDKELEAEAVSNLGKAFQVMGKYAEALQYHEIDLRLSQDMGKIGGKARAYGNIGLVHETLGNYEEGLLYQEHHLNAATQMDDAFAKAIAFSSIGRIHHALGNNIQAVAYLQQGLQLVETLHAEEEEAKIRHFLGVAFWRHGDTESAQAHLEKSSDLLETIRQNTYGSGSEYSLALFDQQIASYQALQRILVQMGRTDLTLLFAEKSRTLANSTLLSNKGEFVGNGQISGDPLAMATLSSSSLINSVDAIMQRVNRHRVAVLYFSIAGGYLYSWLLIPDRGIVKFNESCISNEEDEEDGGGGGGGVTNMGNLLERYIAGTRDALGIDFNVSGSTRNLCSVGGESDGGCEDRGQVWNQHLEELGDKLNQDNDKTGFLRMVSRNHRFNCSSYSLSSLFSVGSATGSVKSSSTSRPGSTRSSRRSTAASGAGGSSWQGPSCLRSLYQMLIAPFEEELSVLDQTCFKELVLVLETDLLLVPFPLLRSCTNEEYLCEKFKLIVAPSISSIRSGGRCKSKNETSIPLVIGNPSLSPAITEQWGWEDIPRAQSEAGMISEILQCQPLTGSKASKESVLNEIFNAEVVHFATHISWKLSGIVLSPGNGNGGSRSTSSGETGGSSPHKSDGNSSDGNDGEGISGDLAPFSDYLLTAADILKLRLNAKLVVLSSCHTRDKLGLANGDSIIALTKALLAAGAMSVLVTLWPVPETASKIFFRSFYSSLLQGSKVSHALTEAMLTVQHTKHFAHPANWAGYLLLGSDVQLSNKVTLTSQAMWELMKSPERSRDALRVSLHLVEKSLQRISNGQKNAMYTTQKSIENKVGNAAGWKEVLISVGFRFEPASNGLPSAVFFPQNDPGERLGKCSASLQALLGLSPQSLNALSKLLSTPEAGEEVISILRQAIAELATKNLEVEKVEVKIDVKLWGVVGCHELLASLGFDLIEVGENEVIVGIGQHVTMRMLQVALQATLALFETHEAIDRQGSSFERSLSMESLELGTEELCEIANVRTAMQGPAYLPARQPIAMGKGAFTSYVRSRGEPDGHTNTTNDQSKQRDLLELKFSHHLNSTGGIPPIPNTRRPPLPAMRGSHTSNNPSSLSMATRTYQNIAVQRADSSSSGSSAMTDWENGLTTVRRRAAPPIPGNAPDAYFNVGGHSSLAAAISAFDSPGSDPEFLIPSIPPARKTGRFIQHTTKSVASSSNSTAAGKRVTWKMNELAAANANKGQSSSSSSSGGSSNTSTATLELKPWMAPRNTFSVQQQPPTKEKDIPANKSPVPVSTRSSNLHDHLMKSSPINGRDLPLSDVYQERNVGLGLAPSLSKLLLSNRMSLGPIDNSSNNGNKSDTEGGNMSVDDTMSTFDQLSLADDSAPESSTPPFKLSSSSAPSGRKGLSSIKLRGLKSSSRLGTSHSKNGQMGPPKPGGQRMTSGVDEMRSGPFVTTAEISAEISPISLNLAEGHVVHDLSGSSTSSSKSSPSDFSKERDEGDGRSLTDSQYGSYSPSMAQNDLIVQTATAVYFANRSTNGTNCESQGSKTPSNCDTTNNTNNNNNSPSSKNNNEHVLLRSENNNVNVAARIKNMERIQESSMEYSNKISSPVRNSKNKLSIQLNSFSSNQKSSQC